MFFSPKKTCTELMLSELMKHSGKPIPTSRFSHLGIRGYVKIKCTLRKKGYIIDSVYEKERDKRSGKIRTMKVFYIYRGFNNPNMLHDGEQEMIQERELERHESENTREQEENDRNS